MLTLSRFATLTFLVMVSITFGYFIRATSLWPTPQIQQIFDYVVGDGRQATTFTQRVANDFGGRPYRNLVTSEYAGMPGRDYVPVILNMRETRPDTPRVMIDPSRPPALTFIHGVWDLEDGLHGALVLDETGKVIHQWRTSQEPGPVGVRPDRMIIPHGIEVFRDGSVIFAFDKGRTLTRLDACGAVLWTVEGYYDHSVTRTDAGTVWVWQQPSISTEIDIATGATVRSFTIEDIAKANPEIDIFGARRVHFFGTSVWLFDPYHGNDVDPLPTSLANRFPMFEAGDLLVSLRSHNMVFVVDPDNLEVKWWRQGLTRRQHDPDWRTDGTFLVFDNRMAHPPSRIIAIDPDTMQSEVIIDGADYGFYSSKRGKIQETEEAIIVTSSEQGRVFEVAPDGRLLFDFLNVYDAEAGLFGVVSEARRLPLDYFDAMPDCVQPSTE